MKKKLAPIEADTLDKILLLHRQDVNYRGYWMLTDGYDISVMQQKMGERPTQEIKVPKKIFDVMIRWYMTGSTKK